ncbi:hypothetical protein [Acidisphaera sp. L21]|uniref:hypothetical protein n=1 Tax=Acidisphaera sp. L21 TaxID=1641851 RepID=UPI00131BC4BD|nr:hypothetical protein [Acidisphaera sp. L21]
MLLIGLLVILALHTGGELMDSLAAIRSPLEIDYGEGIVWQQAILIPGPAMYRSGSSLPFIVFHYPPLYYLATHIAAVFTPDLLTAGRIVSCLSAATIAIMVTGLVLAATPTGSQRGLRLVCAVAAGLLAYNVHALRIWGMLMRVDTLAVALALAGILVAARSNGKWRSTTVALLLCVAAVYCKQTELPAGLAVFAIAILRSPRSAVCAASIALLAGLIPLVGLQLATHGGFLHNIIGDNINRFDLASGMRALVAEAPSLPLSLVIVFAGFYLLPSAVTWRDGAGNLANHVTVARALLLLHLALSTLMLATIFKSGGSFNYFLDWLVIGSALAGVLLSDVMAKTHTAPIIITTLCAAVLISPVRFMLDYPSIEDRARQETLVLKIEAAAKPVASEDMVVLMRAGKPVIYEPAIVTELVALGRWDERPLVTMIASGGFAFMLTEDDFPGATTRRSPAVNQAMRENYPVVEQVTPGLWMHRPR